MSRALITVSTLMTQLRERGAVELPADALITPAAADWLRGAHVRVQQMSSTAAAGRAMLNGQAGRVSGPVLYFAGDPADAVVQTLRPMLERAHGGLQFVTCAAAREGTQTQQSRAGHGQAASGRLADLLAGLQELCARLAGCSRRRGVLVTADGAIACAVVNKHPHVRAAIVTRPTALYALTRELGANLLILETERLSLRQILALSDEFLRGKSEVHPSIAAAVETVSATASAHTGGGNGRTHPGTRNGPVWRDEHATAAWTTCQTGAEFLQSGEQIREPA